MNSFRNRMASHAKRFGILSLGAALALSLGAAVTPSDALAQGAPAKGAPAKGAPAKGKPAEKKAAVAAEAPTTKKAVSIQPAELAWGIDKKRLATIYDKVIDDDYKARYQKAQPGPQMDRLDAEVAEKKSEFRRSQVDFGAVPNGLDATPLRSEYSYSNKESMLQIERAGKTRYFFFINDKLWKIIDAVKLGEKSAWGKTFPDASSILNKHYGVDGRVRPADAANGLVFQEVDWKSAQTQVRAVDWGNDEFAIVFQDSATVSQLGTLRKNKEAGKVVDAKVKDAGVKKEPAPPAKDAKKPAGKK